MRNRENAKYFKLGVIGAAVVAFGLVLFFLLYQADGFSGALGTLSGILRPFIIGAVLAVHYSMLFSSGGSGRSQTWIEDFDTLPKDCTKIRIKEGCRTNVRKTPSMKGKSLGVIGKGHGYTVKLAKSRKIAYDSRGVMFYAIRYKGKDA